VAAWTLTDKLITVANRMINIFVFIIILLS
jgi:hypothetical protein